MFQSTVFFFIFLIILNRVDGGCTVGTDCGCNATMCACYAGFYGLSAPTAATQICTACPAGEASPPGSTSVSSCVAVTATASATAKPTITSVPTLSSSRTSFPTMTMKVTITAKVSLTATSSSSSSSTSIPTSAEAFAAPFVSQTSLPTMSPSVSATSSGTSLPTMSASSSATASSIVVSTDCLAGTYKAIVAFLETCVDCPAGLLSPAGSTSITDCVNSTIFASTTPTVGINASASPSFQTGVSPTPSFSPSPTFSITIPSSCLAGEYLYNDLLLNECLKCPIGFTSPAGSTSSTACVACGAGKFWSGQECSSCFDGTYQSSTSFIGTSCTLCPAGRFGIGPSSTSFCSGAVSCPAGYFAVEGARNSIVTDPTTCAICPAGSYSSSNALICTPCITGGAYSELPGSTFCSVCPIGQYTYGYAEGCGICSSGSKFVGVNVSCQPMFPSPTDTVFYFSGSESEGIKAFSGIYNDSKSKLMYWKSNETMSIPAEALVSKDGGRLVSYGRSLQAAMPTGPGAFSASTWVQCEPNGNPFSVIAVWGQGFANWAIKSVAFLVTRSATSSPLDIGGSIIPDIVEGTPISNPRRRVLTSFDSSSEIAIVGTLAGDGTKGIILKDGAGLNANFYSPQGITVDASFNAYVADSDNHCIRKISSRGIVTTFAGNGTEGFEDGVSSSAKFSYPTGVAVDALGFVYVTDSFNNRIRKIKPNGDVSTLAGNGTSGFADGTGTNAMFADPSGIAVDSAGNVYVADFINSRIRLIKPNGEVKTLAGNGELGYLDGPGDSAMFHDPVSLAVDTAGEFIFVADQWNSCIRKVDILSRNVSTFAGQCGEALSLDGTGTNAGFQLPQGIAVDSKGNIFVTDSSIFGRTIRRITPSGIVTTLAGSFGSSGYYDQVGTNALFKDPFGIAVDTYGNLFVADTEDNRIRKILFFPGPFPVCDSTWHHIAITYSGRASTPPAVLKTYIDGNLSSTSSVFIDIGKNDATLELFPGGISSAAISDLRFYNRAVSTAEVLNLSYTPIAYVSCPAGFYSSSKICLPCPTGTFSFSGATSCTCLLCGGTEKVLDKINISSVDSAVEVLAQVSLVVNDLAILSNSSGSTSIGGGSSSTNSSNANATSLKSGIISLIETITNVFSDAADAYVTSRSTSNLTSLLNDTTILIPAAVSELLATNLVSLTSNPAQLTKASATTALDALSDILTLNLPLNVLSGAVDAEGGGTRNASGVTPFSVSAASTFLTAINNVLNKFQEDVTQVDKSGSSNGTSSAASSFNQVGDTLNLLTAAVLRSSNAGSASISVVSAPPTATFNSSSTIINSFCGDALSLTATRISVPNSTSNQQTSALNLPLEKPLSPCLTTSATVAKQQAVTPAVSANGAFLRTAKTASGALTGSVDVSFVQFGVSPVPQTVGWASIGGVNNKVIDFSSSLDTRVVSFKLLSQNGQKLEISGASSPMTLSIPFTNPLISSSSSSVVSSYSRLSFNITCPGKSGLLIDEISTNAVFFLQALKSSSTVIKTSTNLTIVSNNKATGQALISVPCGNPIGIRNITCRGSNTSYTLSYDCPSISLQPVCAFWNETLNAWSSSGCFVSKVDRDSISCSCNHTTNFAARFVALADMQEDLFSSESLSALARPEELLRTYPHVFIIIGVITGLVVISSLITYELDVRASSRFYETLRTDPEVKFLERIETLKGNVFILDRVMDQKVYQMQDKISRARLQTYAKEIAEAEGLFYIGHREVLPVDIDINKFDWTPKKTSFLLSNFFSSFFTSAATPNHEAIQSLDAEKRLQAPSMQSNPMQLKGLPSPGPTSLTIQSSTLPKQTKGWLQRLTHKYTRAIYSKIKGAFESFKVSADSNLSFISKSAGIPASIVEAVETSKDEFIDDFVNSGQENIEEILHDIQNASSWTRFIKLRSFLVRTWVLFVLFNHPYISIFTKYDPRNPRYLRMLKLSIVLVGNLWATSFLFSFVNVDEGVRTIPEVVVVALLSCLLQVPISLLTTFFIRNASVAEFDSRYPYIAAELRRRARVEEHLSKMSQTLLEAELKNVSLDYQHFSKSRIAGLSLDGVGLNPLRKRLEKDKKVESQLTNVSDNLLLKDALQTAFPPVLSPIVATIESNSPSMSPRDDGLSSPTSEDDFDKQMFSRSQRSLCPVEIAVESPIAVMDDFDQEMFAKSTRNLRIPHSKKSNFGPMMKNQANSASGNLDLDDEDEDTDTVDKALSSSRIIVKALSSESKLPELNIQKLDTKASFSENVHPVGSGDFEPKDHSNIDKDDKNKIDIIEQTEVEEKNIKPDDFSFGWINAPPDLQQHCPGLLRCCGRHPDQRSAYIERKRKLEEQKHALLEKKKQEAREKRNKKKSLVKKKGSDVNDISDHEQQFEPIHVEHKTPVKNAPPTASTLSSDAAFTARNAASTALGMNALSPALSPLDVTSTSSPSSERSDNDDRAVTDDLGDYQGSGDDTGDEILGFFLWAFAPLWTLLCNNGRVTDRSKTVVSLESIVRGSSRNLNATKGASKRSLQEVDNETETQDSILKQAQAKFSIVRVLPCTMSMLIAILVCCLIMGFQIFYISLFGFRHSADVTLSLTITWVLSQLWNLFIIEPSMSFVELLITFVIRPAWLPYLLWIPRIGPLVAGKVASDMVSQDGRSILSGRMQNLTLVKAAGAASQLSPELAVVAYGFGAVISATLSNVEDKLLTLSKKKKSGAHENPHTDTKLSQNQRNELIVHRYILAQLHSVEEAQRNRKLLAMKLAKVASVKGKKRIIRDSTAEGEDDNEETTTKVPIVFTRGGPSTEVTDNPMRSTTSIEEGEI